MELLLSLEAQSPALYTAYTAHTVTVELKEEDKGGGRRRVQTFKGDV